LLLGIEARLDAIKLKRLNESESALKTFVNEAMEALDYLIGWE
jgi:hypothetical protein